MYNKKKLIILSLLTRFKLNDITSVTGIDCSDMYVTIGIFLIFMINSTVKNVAKIAEKVSAIVQNNLK